MRKPLLLTAAALSLGVFNSTAHAADHALITEQQAVEAALAELGVEVLGVRFDEPDTQWDVFIKLGDNAYEVEVDAASGKIVAAEQESLAEVQAELSGDLSHEGVAGDVD